MSVWCEWSGAECFEPACLEHGCMGGPAEAKAEHERLMRDDPKYRAEYDEVSRIWDAVFRDKRL